MPKIPKKCPACHKDLVVSRLTCSACGTEVSGSFPLDPFARLAPNDYDFIVLFVKTKGNIKEMERMLGISYWTIRSKLNEIVDRMNLENDEVSMDTKADQRQAILEQLNAGLIPVQEAAEALEKLKKGS
jgi:hypothetical protein